MPLPKDVPFATAPHDSKLDESMIHDVSRLHPSPYSFGQPQPWGSYVCTRSSARTNLYYSTCRGRTGVFPANVTKTVTLPPSTSPLGANSFLFQNLLSAKWAIYSFYRQGGSCFNAIIISVITDSPGTPNWQSMTTAPLVPS